MAPEVVNLANLTEEEKKKSYKDAQLFAVRADLYSLGLVLMESYLVGLKGLLP